MWLIYKFLFNNSIKKLENKFIGKLKIVFPNNKSIVLGKGYKVCELRVLNNYYALKFLFFGVPYLGYGYYKKYWTTNNLNLLLKLGIQNKMLFKAITVFDILINSFIKLEKTFSKNTIRKSKKQISYHYDLGNKFYSLWLDSSMTYSSALFNKNQSLEDAQINKYKNLVNITNINKNTSILEIGCGWGGFIKYINKNIGSNITGITISEKQYSYLKKNNNLNNTRLSLELKDYRTITKKFDRIISIEMFEAVGKHNWNTYFKTLNKLLKNKGSIGLQIITIAEENYSYYLNKKDFIQKYIFPGGMLPTKNILRKLACKNNLTFEESKSFGIDYAKTLSIWKNNFIKNWDKIEELGYDKKFKRLWEYYLSYCEIGFSTRYLDVSQFLLRKNFIDER